jgi:hypothetical protein
VPTMTGHRMSSLPIVQYCSGAAELGKRYGTTRRAVIGRAGHARLSQAAEYPRLAAQLTPRELEEVESWVAPATVQLDFGDGPMVLDYASADKEFEVGLTEDGHAAYHPDLEECLTIGHLDFGWVRKSRSGRRLAVVVDIKRTAFATVDDTETLQLKAYGFGYSKLNECDAFLVGLWIPTEGQYRWGRWHEMGGDDGRALWDRIRFAASNTSSGFVSGDHCSGCWQRRHCPEYMLPSRDVEDKLAVLAEGFSGEIQPDKAYEIWQLIRRMADTAEAAEKQLKGLVKLGAITVLDGKGKRLGVVSCQGRESVDMKYLRQRLGPEAQEFIKRGAPYEMVRWVTDQAQERKVASEQTAPVAADTEELF